MGVVMGVASYGFHKPLLVGRVLRTIAGVGSLYLAFGMASLALISVQKIISFDLSEILFIVLAFQLVKPVVNIGFSVRAKNIARYVIVLLSVLSVVVDLLVLGSFPGKVLLLFTTIWVAYVYTHLGFSFLLAAVIGTPGCEMRAMHHLYFLIKKQPVEAHHCPAFLHKVDEWEAEFLSNNKLHK